MKSTKKHGGQEKTKKRKWSSSHKSISLTNRGAPGVEHKGALGVEMHHIVLDDEKRSKKQRRRPSSLQEKTFECDRIACLLAMTTKNESKSTHHQNTHSNKMTLPQWRLHRAEHIVRELAQIQYVLLRATKEGRTVFSFFLSRSITCVRIFFFEGMTLPNEEHIKKCYNETKSLLGKNSGLIDPFDPTYVFEEQHYHHFLSSGVRQPLVKKIARLTGKKQALMDELVGKTMESSAFVMITPLFFSTNV